MGNKYSSLQIGIHWLVFFLVIVLTPRWNYVGSCRAVIDPGLISRTFHVVLRF